MLCSTGMMYGTGSGGGGGGGGDPYFANVVLLLGFEGADGTTSTADESSSAKTVTFNGNAQIDTAQFKFGTSSLLLDGSGDFLSLADSADWDFGSGQFTVEAFVRLSSVDNTYCIASQWSSSTANDAWAFYADNAVINQIRFRFMDSGGTLRDANSGLITNVANQWFHFAADRDATGKVRVYIDGVMVGSATNSQTFRNSPNNLRIGSVEGFPVYDTPGWIDELRITKGVARYASDSGFTVPVTAYPRS
ncbi:LamG domain-containing protein [Mesorhizobium qingshengii]|uniref:Concanavalin A-like lectin/glucanases superfamily protein n=1 Tax=Mesorhizobium qingshengii TaxID=1165689 RepID=A0A1G5V4L3_9HYPH|nr:LamG domain-containing protein [Mesorhizobium qingshengii]SDA40336.1 Concanavalin A-like lectin/glucanases superfamily protein [Mesorhizobium qingshengii]